MTPQERAKKAIKSFATRTGSDFEEITHRGSIKLAKVEYGNFQKVDKTMETIDIQDEISFLHVEAEFLSVGDPIVFNDKNYNIEFFSPVLIGIYNIFAKKTTRTGRTR